MATNQKRKSKRKLKERPFGAGTLTEAGRHAKIVSGLRNASKYWKPKMVARKAASVGRKTNKKTGRLAEHFTCSQCGEEVVSTDLHMDHITPLVDECGFTNWDDFIERMFVETEGWQAVCKPCHKIKTLEEKQAREAFKKKQKELENV